MLLQPQVLQQSKKVDCFVDIRWARALSRYCLPFGLLLLHLAGHGENNVNEQIQFVEIQMFFIFK